MEGGDYDEGEAQVIKKEIKLANYEYFNTNIKTTDKFDTLNTFVF